MKIIIDVMSGDNAPLELIKGASMAAQAYPEAEITVVGQEDVILRIVKEESIPFDRIHIKHADSVIEMEDRPLCVVREKKDSSMAVGLELLKSGEGDAFVSAGNTGALIAGATLVVRRIKGVQRAGIAIHNRGKGFYLDADSKNCLAPGKRPYHTIIPGFITKDGEAVGPFGVMGAFMQPQGHLQTALKLIEYHHNPQAALDAPRWYWTGGKTVQLEHGVPLYIARALEQMGHEIQYSIDRSPFGRGQMIIRTEQGTLAAGTDPRCDGAAAAY